MTTSEALPVPRLVRRRGGLAGVCAGTADHLQVSPAAVRWIFVALTVVWGSGIAAYLALWLLTPRVGRDGEVGEAPTAGLSRPTTWLLLAGVLVIGGGLIVVDPGRGGWAASVQGVLPLLAVGAGALIAWSQLDRTHGRREGALRVGVGAVLAVLGVVVLVAREQGTRLAGDVLLATLAVVAGLVLVLAPWGMRFWERYQAEQRTRIRETERADIAAHLHDSVLQTLALIQRTDDPVRIARLARAQERELRAWLYGGPATEGDSLVEAVTGVAHEIEDLHGVPIDLVVTGDRPLDPAGEALVAATREALANAVRHGAPPVSAYVEVTPRMVEVFVRDHGAGFDLDAVPEDRLGVRQSLFGRMERHGGSARIRRLEEGTEVALALPVDPDEGRGPATGAGPDLRPGERHPGHPDDSKDGPHEPPAHV